MLQCVAFASLCSNLLHCVNIFISYAHISTTWLYHYPTVNDFLLLLQKYKLIFRILVRPGDANSWIVKEECLALMYPARIIHDF